MRGHHWLLLLVSHHLLLWSHHLLIRLHLLMRHHLSHGSNGRPLHNGHSSHPGLLAWDLWGHPLLLGVRRPHLVHHARVLAGLLLVAHHAWIVRSLHVLVHHARVWRRLLILAHHHLGVELLLSILRHHHHLLGHGAVDVAHKQVRLHLRLGRRDLSLRGAGSYGLG